MIVNKNIILKTSYIIVGNKTSKRNREIIVEIEKNFMKRVSDESNQIM
jgi:hypothetical protein